MHHQLEVIYENGVLRPLRPLPEELREREHYTITLESHGTEAAPLDETCMAAAAINGNPAVDLTQVRDILARINGTLAQAARDERQER
jgi:predicted DNA-binding antitoxin AbrB/MazE fold protein